MSDAEMSGPWVTVLIRAGDGKAKRMPAEGYRREPDGDLVLLDDGDEEIARFAAGMWLGAYKVPAGEPAVARSAQDFLSARPVKLMTSGGGVWVSGPEDDDGPRLLRLLARTLADERSRLYAAGLGCQCAPVVPRLEGTHRSEACPFYGNPA